MRIDDSGSPLSDDERRRFARHLVLPEVGEAGQRRLRDASVLLVGAGGLGSPVALYLAAAGVGRIGLVDFDRVSLDNLQRQVLYGTADLGRPKVDAARERLAAMDPAVRVETLDARLTAASALEVLRGWDVVVDGADNFPARYLVNDACVMLGIPDVHGSVHRFEGQVSVFAAPGGPCYRCLHPVPPPAGLVPSCAEGGVLGVLPGVIGTVQAAETLKLLLGAGEPLVGRVLLFDALAMRFRELALARDPACPRCGDRPSPGPLADLEDACADATPRAPTGDEVSDQISAPQLAARLARGEDLTLLDVREPHEHEHVRLPGALHIPLHELGRRAGGIDRDRTLVVYCHHGIRSQYALRLLREMGYTQVLNLRGGIDAWSTEVDRSVRRY
jgi:sulfur-carrier protein adenylyltransferase/sulfurtransferase